MIKESFIRKITTTGDATGITLPKHIVDYRGFTKGKIVKVTVELLDEKQCLNSEAKAASNAESLELGLVRASVKDLAFSGSKEDYMSGRFAVLVAEESWAEQWMLGYPNKNLNPNVKIQ